MKRNISSADGMGNGWFWGGIIHGREGGGSMCRVLLSSRCTTVPISARDRSKQPMQSCQRSESLPLLETVNL